MYTYTYIQKININDSTNDGLGERAITGTKKTHFKCKTRSGKFEISCLTVNKELIYFIHQILLIYNKFTIFVDMFQFHFCRFLRKEKLKQKSFNFKPFKKL